jgi:hypothetical protein
MTSASVCGEVELLLLMLRVQPLRIGLYEVAGSQLHPGAPDFQGDVV